MLQIGPQTVEHAEADDKRASRNQMGTNRLSVRAPRRKPATPLETGCASRGYLVEVNGIEPSASSMPFRGEVKKNE
jgi:hypothetical protein